MTKDLENLLFYKPIGKGKKGSALFNSQTELAKLIFNQPLHSGFKSTNSIKTYLSKVLRGERAPSKNLIDGMLKAIKNRLSDEWSYNSIEAEFYLSVIRDDGSPVKQRAEFTLAESELLGTMKKEGHHVFIMYEPFFIYESNLANEVKSLIIQNLNLTARDFNIETDTNFEYEFYVDEDSSIRIWQELSDALEKELSNKHGIKDDQVSKSRLRDICNKPHERLLVFKTFAPIAAHNLYLYNIDQLDPEITTAYQVYRDTTSVNVSRIPFKGYHIIRSQIYSKLRGFLRDLNLVKDKVQSIALEEKKFGKTDQFKNEQ